MGTETPSLKSGRVKNCSIWKDCGLRADLIRQPCDVSDSYNAYAEDASYSIRSSKQIMDWWKGLKREDTGNPGEDISTISKTVRYFKKWDSEKQIAYFGEQDQNGSLVAEETDTSFLENLSDLEGHYVLAETRAREDEFIGPDTLLSIKPVETNVGTVTSANAERITIGNDAYSTPEWLLQPDSYEKKFVLYHIYEEKIVSIETLKTEKGTLTQWNADTRAVTIDPEGADKDACVYTLSTLADDETLTRLGETGQKQIVVHYIADSNHFLYRVKLLPVSISYSSDYVRETEDSITYTIQIEATNNNTEAALTDVFIKMGVGNDSVLLDDDPVQEKSTLAAGEKMTAEYTVRLDKKTYTDGSKYYFTVSAGAAGVETASENGSVQVKYRNQKPDVWSIVNGGTYWGNRGYYITKNDYERLLSNLPATSRERLNFIIEFEAIKNQYGISQMKAVNCLNVDGEAEKGTYAKWGGSCYGLSAWVCLVASGIRSAADISKAAATLYESGGNDCKDEVTSAINFYQSQTRSTVFRNLDRDFKGKSQKEQIQCLEQLATAASSGGKLVDISFAWYERLKDGTIDTEKQKDHTVVGYGIETGDYTAYVRKMMGDSVQNTTFTHRILIYDCNCPDGDEACNIYYSDDDVWCIPHYGIVGIDTKSEISEYNNGGLGCVTADEEILNAIDYKTGKLSEKAKNAVPTGNMLDYSLESEFVLNWSGNTANVNGAIVSGNTGNERIYTSIAPNVTADRESTETTATAYLPDADSYTVTTKEDAVAFQFESSSYLNTAISSAPGTATFQTTGGATLKTTEEGMTYISITSNAGLNKLPWNTLAAIGDGATEIAMQPSEQGVLLSGDNLDGITILGRGKGELKEVTFSTGEDAVMISQNEGELAILVDKDHDGVFETDITPAIANGTCGDQLTWMLDSVGTLSITGTGAMEIWGGSYSQKWGSTARAPWYGMRDQIKKVVVGEQVTSLSPYAFEGCANLNQVSLPDTLLVIGDYAFSECRKLNTLKLPGQLLSIGTGAFIGCKGLKELTIPSTVCYTGTSETEGMCTLEYCDTICGYTNSGAYWYAEKWGIPFQSLGTLSQGDPGYIGGELIATGQKGTYVFWALYGDGQLFYSGTGAMDETNVLNGGSAELLYEHGQEVKRAVFTEGVTSVGASALASNRGGSGEDEKFNALTSVEVADSVVKIDKRAFFDCPALQSVTIGAGVTAIGDYVFSYDNALSQIRVSGDNPFFKSENNILFSKDGRVLYRYPHNTDASYTIPKLTEVIAVDAFGDCTALTKITISTSVTEIKSDAFDGCSSLTDVYYDGSKTDWNAVVIESNNGALTGATIHFGLPSEEIKSLTDCSVMLDCYSYTYDSKGKKPTVTVKDGSTTLTSGKDYEVTYADNTDAGTAKVTITGKGGYSGSVTKEFTIQKANQTLSASISASSILVGGTAQITASAKTGMSYSSSDTKVAAVSASGVVTAKAVGTATITVTAKASKNYNEASKNVTVTVTEKSVPVTKKLSACKVTLAKTSYTYDGKAKKPAVTVKDGSTTLTNGKDYEVAYANNINAGTARVTITGEGNYTGTVTMNVVIKKAASVITASNITKATSAKAQKASIGAKVKGGAKLTYKSNNKYVTVDKKGQVTIAKKFVGQATITITAAATKNYNAGTKKVTVTVNPASTKLSSVKNSASKSMKVAWKKNAAVTGYQVQYATAKNFKGAKAVTVKKAKTTSVTIKKLAKDKKYYVRVRTYQKVSGKTYYSAWSASKNVTIKK